MYFVVVLMPVLKAETGFDVGVTLWARRSISVTECGKLWSLGLESYIAWILLWINRRSKHFVNLSRHTVLDAPSLTLYMFLRLNRRTAILVEQAITDSKFK